MTEHTHTVKSEAEKIWEEIKALPLSLFGLPAQSVEKTFTYSPVEPTACYLTTKIAAALPALETILGANLAGAKFSVELVDKYTVVRRVAAK